VPLLCLLLSLQGQKNGINSHSQKSFSDSPPACLGRRAGDSQAGRQCSLGRTSRGSRTKVTAAKKYTKILLGQAEGVAYLLFRSLPLYVIALAVSQCPQDSFCPSAGTGRYRRMPGCRPGLACRPSSNLDTFWLLWSQCHVISCYSCKFMSFMSIYVIRIISCNLCKFKYVLAFSVR
jgi:hypothetical protein